MGSKKKNASHKSDKTKGHQNGQPKQEGQNGSTSGQGKTESASKAQTSKTAPSAPSKMKPASGRSKLWLLVVCFSILVAGVAVLLTCECTRSTLANSYKQYGRAYVHQAADFLSLDVGPMEQWLLGSEATSDQPAEQAHQKDTQTASSDSAESAATQADDTTQPPDDTKQPPIQKQSVEKTEPHIPQSSEDKETQTQTAEGVKPDTDNQKAQAKDDTTKSPQATDEKKQTASDGDTVRKPEVQDIRVKATHKSSDEVSESQDDASQKSSKKDTGAARTDSDAEPSNKAPAASSGDDSNKVKPAKDRRQSYSKSAITNNKDYTIRKQLDDADSLLEKGSLDEALQHYDAIISRYPSSPRALAGKAETLDKMAEKKRSNQLLEQSISTYNQLLTLSDVPEELMKQSARRLANRQQFRGWGQQAAKTMKFLADRYPHDLALQRELGVSHLMVGQNAEAKQVFQQLLQREPSDGFAMVHLGFIYQTSDNDPAKAIPLLQAGIESDHPGTQDGRFYFHLGSALQRQGRNEEAQRLYERGASKGLFLSADQRSLYNVDTLTGRPWWTAEQTGYKRYLKLLENNWQVIRDEALSQLNSETGDFRPEDENLRETGDWKQLTMYSQGRQHRKMCAKVPRTCELIEQIEPAKSCRRGQVKFSVMQPGVHVWPHCGPTNCRIRAHLGLVVPPGPRIRVVNDTRTWKEGKFIIFDDSFEHEVWHDGDSFRLVLIVDFWHPELTEQQRRTLTPI